MPAYKGQRPKYSGRVLHGQTVTESDADTPLQVVEAFTSAMEALYAAPPSSLSELRSLLGGSRRAATALTPIAAGTSEKDRMTKIRTTERQLQRYIVAESGGVGAHGGRQARGTRVANREELRRKMQALLQPQLDKRIDAAITTGGVAMQGSGSLNIVHSTTGPGYTSPRFVHWLVPPQAWGGRDGILAAWRRGHKQTAARRWHHAWAEAYKLPDARWARLDELSFYLPEPDA